MKKEYENIEEIKTGDWYISKDGVYEMQVVAVLPWVVVHRTVDAYNKPKFYSGLHLEMKDEFMKHNCKKITISPEKEN